MKYLTIGLILIFAILGSIANPVEDAKLVIQKHLNYFQDDVQKLKIECKELILKLELAPPKRDCENYLIEFHQNLLQIKTEINQLQHAISERRNIYNVLKDGLHSIKANDDALNNHWTTSLMKLFYNNEVDTAFTAFYNHLENENAAINTEYIKIEEYLNEFSDKIIWLITETVKGQEICSLSSLSVTM